MIRVNDDAAELVGIALGDGNMNKSDNRYEFRIILNKKEIMYAGRVCKIIRKVLGESPRIYLGKTGAFWT